MDRSWIGCLGVALAASVAAADPALTVKTEAFANGNSLAYSQLVGAETPAEQRFNRVVRNLASSRVLEEGLVGRGRPWESSRRTGVALANRVSPRLLTVGARLEREELWEPSRRWLALTYDLEQGRVLDLDDVLRAEHRERVAAQVRRKLLHTTRRAERREVYAHAPRAQDLESFWVGEDGLTFVWDGFWLGLGPDAGRVATTLGWAELGDAVRADAPLEGVRPRRPQVDLALGVEGPPPAQPVAAAEAAPLEPGVASSCPPKPEPTAEEASAQGLVDELRGGSTRSRRRGRAASGSPARGEQGSNARVAPR